MSFLTSTSTSSHGSSSSSSSSSTALTAVGGSTSSFSTPLGEFMAILSSDGCEIYDILTNHVVRNISFTLGAGSIQSASNIHIHSGFISPNSPFIYTLHKEKSIFTAHSLLDGSLALRTTLVEFGHCLYITPLTYHLIVATPTGHLYIYNLTNGLLLTTLHAAHYRGINTIVVDQKEQFLCTAGQDGVIHVWDLLQLIQTNVGGLRKKLRNQPNNANTSSSSNSSNNNTSHKPLFTISCHSLAITSLYITDSYQLISASHDRTIHIHSLLHPFSSTNQTSTSSSSSSSSSFLSNQNNNISASSPLSLFSYLFPSVLSHVCVDDTETLLYGAGQDGQIYVLPLYPSLQHTQKQQKQSHLSSYQTQLNQPTQSNTSLFNSTSATAASAQAGMVLSVWRGHRAPIISLQLVLASSLIYSLDSNGEIRIWDIYTGMCTRTFHANSNITGTNQSIPKALLHYKSESLKKVVPTVPPPKSVNVNNNNEMMGNTKFVLPPLKRTTIPHTGIVYTSYVHKPLAWQHVQEEEKLASTCQDDLLALSSSMTDPSLTTLLTDHELISGRSKWSQLALSSFNQYDTVNELQEKLNQQHTVSKELYQLAVEQLFTDLDQEETSK